jgi:phthalate 4,5-dioxygenase oxygenase subunit
MLSTSENERLCRVTGNAPMGRMIRRYWIPACLSADVAEPDGTPARVRLLGEDLVAFRDSSGRVGVLDARCPHRLASLALGSNEEGGLRCIYHGWKFGVDGTCMEMPTEPAGSSFAQRLRARSYPVREAGGIVWTYLGPAGTEPRFPAYDWTALPAEQRTVMRAAEHANYAQAIEGSIDSAHSWFLHRGAVRDWRLRSSISSDESPKIEAEDTSYGFRYGAVRIVDANPETERYVRVTLFAMPFTSFIPRPMNPALPGHVQIFVPVDDEHTMFYGVWFSQNGEPLDVEKTLGEVGFRPGVDLAPVTYERFQNPANWWQQDRAAMRDGSSYTGVSGVLQQDMAVQESMGPQVDRSQEHLGTSDVAIIRMRRRMLEALDAFERDGTLVGTDPGIPIERIRSEQRVIPADAPWQIVGAFGDEFPAAAR